MKQPMVVGTWSWGDKYFGDFDEAEMYPKIKEAFEFAVNEGVTMFDTAEMYGDGKSEELLGCVGSRGGRVTRRDFRFETSNLPLLNAAQQSDQRDSRRTRRANCDEIHADTDTDSQQQFDRAL